MDPLESNANAYLFPLLPLVAIAGLSTAGMVLFLFLVFFVGLSNTLSMFIMLLPTFAPANNGGLLSFSPLESSPSSSPSPSPSADKFSPAYHYDNLDYGYYVPYQMNTHLQVPISLHHPASPPFSKFVNCLHAMFP